MLVFYMEEYAYSFFPKLERIPVTKRTTTPEMVYHCLNPHPNFFTAFALLALNNTLNFLYFFLHAKHQTGARYQDAL